MPAKKQRLIHKGKVLRDNQVLSEFVDENSDEIVFHLVAVPTRSETENHQNNTNTNNNNNQHFNPNMRGNIFMQELPNMMNGIDLGQVIFIFLKFFIDYFWSYGFYESYNEHK
jgi:hypothetical protein